MSRASKESAPVALAGADLKDGQDLSPSLLGRSAPDGDASVAWGAGSWNGRYGLQAA